jgi:hypothetical protein
VGTYGVTYTANDVAGNMASCSFSFEVLAALQGSNTATQERTSELPSYVYAVVGGAGGLLLVVLLLIGLLVRYRRRANKVSRRVTLLNMCRGFMKCDVTTVGKFALANMRQIQAVAATGFAELEELSAEFAQQRAEVGAAGCSRARPVLPAASTLRTIVVLTLP